VAEDDRRSARCAIGVIEPGHGTLGGLGGAVLELQVHPPVGIDNAQTRQRIDDETQPIVAPERVVPQIGLVAIHPLQEIAVVVALEATMNVLAVLECLRHRPLRWHPGMDTEVPPFRMGERQRTQPVDQLTAIRCIEDFLQRVGVVLGTGARIDRQQVQVVIAEQGHGLPGFDPTPHLAQCRERLGAAIDDIADEDQAARIRQPRQQRFKTREAALQVADDIGAHGCDRSGCTGSFC